MGAREDYITLAASILTFLENAKRLEFRVNSLYTFQKMHWKSDLQMLWRSIMTDYDLKKLQIDKKQKEQLREYIAELEVIVDQIKGIQEHEKWEKGINFLVGREGFIRQYLGYIGSILTVNQDEINSHMRPAK